MRNYRKEYDNYQGRSLQIKRRSARNKARRKMIKQVGKNRLNGKDIDHKDRNPMNNSRKNLRITSKKRNRSRNN
tara:strand:+ start:4909 stop:5130 length:222 start_codon:yes stop_codon:yes gene_type:complete